VDGRGRVSNLVGSLAVPVCGGDFCEDCKESKERMVMRDLQGPSNGLAQQGRRYSIRLLK
jgi:ribosomal protein L44E